ncbi:MAG: 5-(carboxyamino)imidazole ribonucleotide synthase [Alphaproteobacteria bacterium]|nr:5-(carboxyamino)imidazole ribonucleotide synthase [Alphaproteobacteria bacterium]MCB9975450.1 5-(carboxyamino)imidazole ribonucleotide synthase [Rhodospirillales bacterium]
MSVRTLGILGGGQLGRMSIMAAARLGIRCVVLTPEADSPGSQVAWKTLYAAYEDQSALKELAQLCDAVSYEFENIPLGTVDFLETLKPGLVRPTRKLLEVSQNRVAEKEFLNGLGIETARWSPVQSVGDIEKALSGWKSTSFVLKTARYGYDGKGQIFCKAAGIRENAGLAAFLEQHQGHELIVEDAIDFTDEISVIVARDIHKKTAVYGPMVNEHRNHILYITKVPAPHNLEICAKAVQVTKTLADAVDLQGVLTLEMFVTRGGRLLANEIAPRTHNSGHWTIDACAVSQFEQHVRTVCGLSVGPAESHSDAEMMNLIGPDVLRSDQYLTQQNACLHLYGKQDVREGRKMGHVTFLKEKKT